jgi:ATP-dependent RNA helicase DeaD
MTTFEELGVSPSLVEALAAGGIERPTALQTHAIPVLGRGHSAVLRGTPGSGVLVAFGAPLLDRLDPDTDRPRALILTPGRERARQLALSLARMAFGTEHRVAALGSPWVLSERASILVSTPDDLNQEIHRSRIKVDQVEALILDTAGALVGLEAAADVVSTIMQAATTEDLQVVLTCDPVTPEIRGFVDRNVKRAIYLPPEAASTVEGAAAPQRGRLRVHTVSEITRDMSLPDIVARLLDEDADHVLLFVRSEDRAADAGDHLALHGFLSGAPGDPDNPVWLGVDPLEAREAIRESGAPDPGYVVLSVDLPTDADELDRQHGKSPSAGVVLALPRELPHLRRISAEAGYQLDQLAPVEAGTDDAAAEFRSQITRVLDEEDLLPHLILLEPLMSDRGAAEVAAALSILLRRRGRAGQPGGAVAARVDAAGDHVATPSRPTAWIRLFLSVGEKDGIAPRDLLGAILGESGIDGSDVGKIDLKDTFSRVEVRDNVAERVIRALNGTSIRGRSVRADFDRGTESRARRPEGRKPPRREGSGGPRKGSGGTRSGDPGGRG